MSQKNKQAAERSWSDPEYRKKQANNPWRKFTTNSTRYTYINGSKK